MIRIHKPLNPPKKLVQDGKKKRKSNCLSYSKNIEAYQSGEKDFSFDRSIYAHQSVKQALIKAQHSKCCFCERIISTDGDVEHFRPKQAYKQAPLQPLQRPGYYWLAYEWDNLYLACTGCNQRHKQNLFPLQDPTKRAVNHRHKIKDEQPLFIDPGKEDPEDFLGFRGEYAYAIEENSKGQRTLDALKLNQRSLPEARLQRLQILKQLCQIVNLAKRTPINEELQQEARKAEELLKKATQENSEFAAAARWAIKSNFEFVIE
ncbi:hypothetical protein H6G20_16830 [Desertifilum sp. FACHB-1129]|uniref:TIGR02646 family protein n=2 Tax=Desertifilum tharense IPPAS B-1220 TaxID=1781255 RepID=A0A1E5QMG2_9CYAN|nr:MULTISPECIES: hypothetical protein [Desertifilum]MDA0212722.1 hypothetical protein [Cyanobacteria bacterium FC1]MBD2313334.1 hypothetical protein [Desertifilum sp. FACHB-1129]MBD2324405.1 hypothetical protein [Desertifilum sp. FACHB-866]MBD2334419.1 hypothetical protein [Desertifilum sp. FACHB-868]OEJ75855.1 hypothetical protein BH720_07045 [Desertifilum tharense IPPAS B-1220]